MTDDDGFRLLFGDDMILRIALGEDRLGVGENLSPVLARRFAAAGRIVAGLEFEGVRVLGIPRAVN